jgi:hypothetical protein
MLFGDWMLVAGPSVPGPPFGRPGGRLRRCPACVPVWNGGYYPWNGNWNVSFCCFLAIIQRLKDSAFGSTS